MSKINWKRGLFRLKLLWSLTCILILVISFLLDYKANKEMERWRWRSSGGGKMQLNSETGLWDESKGIRWIKDSEWAMLQGKRSSAQFSIVLVLSIICIAPWILHPFIVWAIKGFHQLKEKTK